MNKPQKKITYENKFLCDICGEEFESERMLDGYELLDGKNGGGPENYKYHVHSKCLFDFWKEHK